jgi:hypothetical protein
MQLLTPKEFFQNIDYKYDNVCKKIVRVYDQFYD